MDDYLKLLEHSYAVMADENFGCPPSSRLEYLADHIFNFTTYDNEMGEEFATKAIEVCAAISNRTTFDYIKDPDNYRWYLLLCNTPFFAERIEWGTSIRAAFWNHRPHTLDSGGLFGEGGEQIFPIHFTRDEWLAFIAAVAQFGATGS